MGTDGLAKTDEFSRTPHSIGTTTNGLVSISSEDQLGGPQIGLEEPDIGLGQPRAGGDGVRWSSNEWFSDGAGYFSHGASKNRLEEVGIIEKIIPRNKKKRSNVMAP